MTEYMEETPRLLPGVLMLMLVDGVDCVVLNVSVFFLIGKSFYLMKAGQALSVFDRLCLVA